MDPLTILAGIKTGLAAGKSIAGLSKQIGQFFDATDAAKKQLQKKAISGKSASQTALDRWAKLRSAADAEEQLKEAWNIWYEKQWNGEISPQLGKSSLRCILK